MRHRIAIVDDEEKVLSSLKRYFELKNYQVETFSEPVKALKVIKSRFIKIVLTDINMPVMNGIEMLSRLKKHNQLIKVIMMTGDATAENVRAAMQKGASGFVVKPFDSLQMVEKEVEKAITLVEKNIIKSR